MSGDSIGSRQSLMHSEVDYWLELLEEHPEFEQLQFQSTNNGIAVAYDQLRNETVWIRKDPYGHKEDWLLKQYLPRWKKFSTHKNILQMKHALTACPVLRLLKIIVFG
ncbi:Oidioi.mRNA.OKI2018_I69.XSR.g15262.t1.cds [Oikopleura dioica]|uniref:Oidioi.mRNA.OKI2018_I69.XSR.g15262.t1.cds n=1 Tax=Oikopleura dioica TaxID=34765 RepID=A0ABN7SCS7_OIKDI|nr:Oidioi.mRNA.OKI2018_I69.XSR.g15262.t1.cds [Oikopleura dioica]